MSVTLDPPVTAPAASSEEPAPPDQLVALYDSHVRRLPALHEWFELLRYRELLMQLVARNIKTRYKRSVLGVFWTMLNPLLLMAVMTVVFSRAFQVNVPRYPVYLLSGLVLWTFFTQTTTTAMTELVWGGALLNRIYIPRTIFAASALGTGLVNLVLSLVPLALIMGLSGGVFTWALLFLPVSILCVSMFSFGLGLVLSAAAIYFADVVEMYQVILLAWMYLTPIMYPIEVIDQGSRWLFQFNPLYQLLELFREPIYLGVLPSLQTVSISVALSLAMFVVGWYFFTSKADEFAYRV